MEQRTQCPKVDREFIRKGLARYSLRCISLVKGIIKKRTVKAHAPGCLKRTQQKVLGPYRHCFQPVRLPAAEGNEEEVVFFAADMKKVL